MLTREQIKSIYEKALANDDHYASEEVQTADDKLDSALMDYITAIQEDTFCWAYALGYKAGRNSDPAEQDEDVAECREEEGWV